VKPSPPKREIKSSTARRYLSLAKADFKNSNFMRAMKNKTEVGGMWGEKVDVTKVNGRLVVQNRPKRKVTADPTAAQTAVVKKFREAASWAKGQVDQLSEKAIYTTGITEKNSSAYVVAMRDYLNAPEVEFIKDGDYLGAIGDPIIIKATDDFLVTRVKVIITDASGTRLEQGDAVQDLQKKFLWEYSATAANVTLSGTKITAIAFDRAGNETSLEKVVS